MRFIESLKTGWKENLEKLWKFFEADAELRRKNQEVNKYNKKWIVYPLGVLLFVSLFVLARNLSITQTIPKILAERPDDFFQVKEGFVHFGDTSKKHKITLPMRNLSDLEGFDVKNIWYEFNVVIPEKFRARKDLGLILPAVWGKYKVYIDNQLVDYGKDYMNVFPVIQNSFNLFIQVDGQNSPKFGIRATYPVVIGNIDDVRRFIDIINDQIFVYTKALIAQLVALFLFLVLFINLPNKPELFLFLSVFIANALYGFFFYFYVENWNQIFISSTFYMGLLSVLSFFRSFLLYYFVLEFFRFSKQTARYLTLRLLSFGCLLIPAGTSVILYKASNADLFSAFRIVQETYFLVPCLLIGLTKMYYLKNHLGHSMRAALGFIIVCAISYNGLVNIYDYFFMYNKVTTEYLNHIYTYFAVAIVTMAEFSRTEKDKFLLAKNLSKEVQEKFLQKFGRFETEHSGLIVLVDMVGFTKTQKRIGSDNQKVFIEGLLRHLMRNFNTGSKLAGTGDGFYFSWKEKYSFAGLTEKIEMINQMLKEKISLRDLGLSHIDDQPIRFRCSIGYGSYVTGIVEEGRLSTDYTSGTILSELSRVIGGGDKKSGLRILVNSATSDLSDKLQRPETQITAKNDERYTFIEYSSDELDFLIRQHVA